jgi:hypothetical protein
MPSPVIDQVITDMTNATTVEDSAIAFINGVPQMIADAVAKAIENGATAEQLQPVSDVGTQLQAKSDALQAALTANTPAAPSA